MKFEITQLDGRIIIFFRESNPSATMSSDAAPPKKLNGLTKPMKMSAELKAIVEGDEKATELPRYDEPRSKN